MKKLVAMALCLIMLGICFAACEEAEEGLDENNDIIIRNRSEQYLYIMIDGSGRGLIENDGIAETMWDGIADGTHVIQAYYNADYTGLHCNVTTDYLSDGEDFNWYLDQNNEYSGTKDGDC
ncbi:hypothetical protein ACFL27_09425 [candidate division CSSED10-310 bacterium]|uniref:Uncharacterized protein n=1 Tax=candidate division CSSED10-310 bacterium TaxID=2855610 RepID=A0ABV6YW37_UNCC1